MRTRKIVRKLRSRGFTAERIMNTLSKAFKDAKRAKDRDWWPESKLRKSLINQTKVRRARFKAKDERKKSMAKRKKKAAIA
jgi:hypothetical protein